MDFIPEGVMIVSPDLRIVFWNTTLEQWTGTLRHEILNKSLIKEFNNLNSPKYLARLQLIHAGGPPAIFSSQLHRAIIPCKLHDGSDRIQHTTVRSIQVPNEKDYFALFVIKDVTILSNKVKLLTKLKEEAAEEIQNRKNVEDVLKKRNEEMELFLDLLTHDLKNYQMLASNYLELAQMDGTSSQEIHEYIQKSRSGILRSFDLINNISIMMKSKLKHNYELEPTNLIQNIIQTIKTTKDLFPNKTINISTDHIEPNLSVLADSLFNQLLLNLFTNVVKNDPHEIIKLDLGLEETPTHCVLSITDYGKGIPPKEREGIFERYTQFRTKGKGSGLGLYIVKTLVERYNGKVWIKSRMPDDYTEGTTFCIELKRI